MAGAVKTEIIAMTRANVCIHIYAKENGFYANECKWMVWIDLQVRIEGSVHVWQIHRPLNDGIREKDTHEEAKVQHFSRLKMVI